APSIWLEYVRTKRYIEAQNRFFQHSGRFPLTARGKINLYALFAELSLQLISENGRAGIVVPSGIAFDDSTKAFFGAVSSQQRLVSLYDFENRKRLFRQVDSRLRFSLLTLGSGAPAAEFAF